MAKKGQAKAAEQDAGKKGVLAGVLSASEKISMPAARALGWRFPLWLAAYFHPEKTFGSEQGGYGKMLIDLLVTGIIYAVISVITYAALLYLAPSQAFSALGIHTTLPLSDILLVLVINPLVLAAGTLFNFLLFFLLAKLLGGSGSYLRQSYALSLAFCGGMLLAAPFSLLAVAPFVGILFWLASVAIALYNLYNYYVIVKLSHQLSPLRAAAVVLGVLAIAFIVAALLYSAGAPAGGVI